MPDSAQTAQAAKWHLSPVGSPAAAAEKPVSEGLPHETRVNPAHVSIGWRTGNLLGRLGCILKTSPPVADGPVSPKWRPSCSLACVRSRSALEADAQIASLREGARAHRPSSTGLQHRNRVNRIAPRIGQLVRHRKFTRLSGVCHGEMPRCVHENPDSPSSRGNAPTSPISNLRALRVPASRGGGVEQGGSELPLLLREDDQPRRAGPRIVPHLLRGALRNLWRRGRCSGRRARARAGGRAGRLVEMREVRRRATAAARDEPRRLTGRRNLFFPLENFLFSELGTV